MADRIRSGRKESFTVLYNSMITDKRLSLKAKGLFAVMMSRPSDWEFSVGGLAAFAGVGKDTIRSGLAELEQIGYILRSQAHNADGTFAGNIYVLQDTAPPLSGNPDDGETRRRETPLPENPTELNKDYNPRRTKEPPIVPQGRQRAGGKKDKSAPKWKPERFEAFWDYYRTHARGEDRQGAVRSWDKLKPDDDLIVAMGHALQAQVSSEDWQRGIGIPYAKTWLNNSRWKDVPKKPMATDSPEKEGERFGWQ